MMTQTHTDIFERIHLHELEWVSSELLRTEQRADEATGDPGGADGQEVERSERR